MDSQSLGKTFLMDMITDKVVSGLRGYCVTLCGTTVADHNFLGHKTRHMVKRFLTALQADIADPAISALRHIETFPVGAIDVHPVNPVVVGKTALSLIGQSHIHPGTVHITGRDLAVSKFFRKIQQSLHFTGIRPYSLDQCIGVQIDPRSGNTEGIRGPGRLPIQDLGLVSTGQVQPVQALTGIPIVRRDTVDHNAVIGGKAGNQCRRFSHLVHRQPGCPVESRHISVLYRIVEPVRCHQQISHIGDRRQRL